MKGIKAIIVAAAAAAALTGCDIVKPDETVGTTVKTYEVTGIAKPRYTRKRKKSFRVSIRDVATGRDLGCHYVARRCHGWYRLENGSRWTFPETTYRRDDGTTYARVDVVDLCKRLG